MKKVGEGEGERGEGEEWSVKGKEKGVRVRGGRGGVVRAGIVREVLRQ